MTEPGADQWARGGDDAEPSAVERYVTRIGKLYGSLATEQLGDLLRVGSTPLCTRAELWAAIDRLDALAYSLGCIEGADLRVVRARQRAQARRRVRELLGLEIER